MVCHGCMMTQKGVPKSSSDYNEECWALTDLMAVGGKLMTGGEDDMRRSANRIKTKLPTDLPGKIIGHSVKTFEECSMLQKRLPLSSF